jgi:hypothetical protein
MMMRMGKIRGREIERENHGPEGIIRGMGEVVEGGGESD